MTRPASAEGPALGAEILERPGMKLIDLSMEIYEGMPIFPAHQRPYVIVNQTHDGWRERYGTKAGFEAHNWLMSEHTGTHTDAVLEYVEDGDSIERMPLGYFYGEAICLDLSHVRHPEWITPEALADALAASGQEIRRGDIVLLYTAHGERTLPGDAYLTDQTGLTRDAAVWLAERGVVNIGIDAVAIDHSDDGDFSGHMVCAEYRISNTENLTNLDQLVNRRFVYFGLPIPFRDGTGSPVRAVAWLS
jgi:kynurenine formamidase